jgi:hypothetical protein
MRASDSVRAGAATTGTGAPTPARSVLELGPGVALPIVREGRFAVVASDVALGPQELDALERRIEDAYAFSLGQHAWEDERPLMKPVNVVVLSTRAFEHALGLQPGESHGVGGITRGPDLFIIPERVARRATPLTEDTFAHELTHVQDLREAGGGYAGAPVLFREGKAYVTGNAFSETFEEDNAAIRDMRQFLGAMTERDVRTAILMDRPTLETEAAGGLFFEYLRVHLSLPDAVARGAQVVDALDEGQTFEQAFEKYFGVTYDWAKRAFLTFISATEGRPEDRVAGTIWEAPAR